MGVTSGCEKVKTLACQLSVNMIIEQIVID